jgi:hypothetical protein
MGDDFYCKKVFLKFKKHTKIKRKKIWKKLLSLTETV